MLAFCVCICILFVGVVCVLRRVGRIGFVASKLKGTRKRATADSVR